MEHQVRRIRNEIVPLRRISEIEVGDAAAVEADGAEEDGAERVDVAGVEVVPGLAVAVEGAAAEDVDVLAAELEEGGAVLEVVFEGVGLPVGGVGRELDCALDILINPDLVSDGLSQGIIPASWDFLGRGKGVDHLPRSMCFRKVKSKAVPIMYFVPREKMTWPPLLHRRIASIIYSESSFFTSPLL